MNPTITTNEALFGARRSGMVIHSGRLDGQLSRMKDRRRQLRVEIVAYENKLAALYTEIGQLDDRLERLDS